MTIDRGDVRRITCEMRDRVARIVLDHPPGNRIDFAMREQLDAAIGQVAASDAALLIVGGRGPDFCRGGDVREWVGRSSVDLRPRIEIFARALAALRDLAIPTLAVVQGACMGGGFELALSCDFVVAAKDAQFRFPEVHSGIVTLQGGAVLLAERIGRSRAFEIVATARTLEAQELVSWGVVHRVAETAELDETAEAFVAELLAAPGAVLETTKRLLDRWRAEGTEAVLAGWYDRSMPLFDAADTQKRLRITAERIGDAADPRD